MKSAYQSMRIVIVYLVGGQIIVNMKGYVAADTVVIV